MTSPHWAEVRFLVPPLSKWSAISSDMKVFKSTSWSPFLLRLAFDPLLTCVGEPGVLERTLILAIAPLRPRKKKKGFRVAQLSTPLESNPLHFQCCHSVKGCRPVVLVRGPPGTVKVYSGKMNHRALTWEVLLVRLPVFSILINYQLLEASYVGSTIRGV